MAHAASARTRRPAPRRRTGSGIRWDRVGRMALLLVLGAILLLYVSPTKHWIEQSGTAGEQRRELSDLTSENRHLKHRVRELRSPGALEREARRLGMVRAGERSYVIENLKKVPGP